MPKLSPARADGARVDAALPVLAIALAAALSLLMVPARAGAADDDFFAEIGARLRALSSEVSPAVVQVFTATYGPLDGAQPGASAFGTRRGSGSGVVLDAGGWIMTNAHVVEGARRVQVLLSPSLRRDPVDDSILPPTGRLIGARIVGIDRETDLALLKIDHGEALPFLKLGDSDALFQGQFVFAYGSPLGLNNSVSMGVVSTVARQLEDESRMIYIQHDAAVNPGNSGGPLVNARGEVVGLNTLIFSQSGGYEGLSFAAPSNIVRTVYEQLRATGRVRRGTLAVRAQTITPWLARGLGLGRDHGVILADVFPGTPAEQAGLRVGDVVIALDGKRLENARQFHVNVYGKPLNQPVTVTVMRDGGPQDIPVVVVERPEPSLRFFDLVSPQRNEVPRLGVLALDLDDDTRQLLPPLRGRDGVIVAAPTAGASVLGQTLQPGDVIYSLNGQPVRNVAELRRLSDAVGYGEPAVLQVERDRQLYFLAMQME